MLPDSLTVGGTAMFTTSDATRNNVFGRGMELYGA